MPDNNPPSVQTDAANGTNSDTGAHDIDIPPESTMLKSAYRQSGLRVADLATATGLSVGTLHIAMNGIRYRGGKARVAPPPDSTIVKLASILKIRPDTLREYNRERAADLLEEVTDEGSTAVAPSDLDAQATVAGRQALARQIFAVFSTEELRAEIARREKSL